jgi:hypothetical protein
MYDMCLATNSGGYVPVQLALTKLYLKWVFLWLTGQSKSGNPFTPQVEDLAQVSRKKVSPPPTTRGPEPTDDMDDILNLTDDFEDDEGFGENSLILLLAIVGAFLLYWRHRVAEPPAPAPIPVAPPAPVFQGQEPPRATNPPMEPEEQEPLLVEEEFVTESIFEGPSFSSETAPLLRERRPFVTNREDGHEEDDQEEENRQKLET